MKNSLHGCVILGLIGTMGCFRKAPETGATTTEFAPLPYVGAGQPHSYLKKLRSLEGIPHEIVERKFVYSGDWGVNDFFRSDIEVRLPGLTAENCQKLKAAFPGSRSKVRCGLSTPYTLADFLPPMVQALSGNRFVPETVQRGRGGIVGVQNLSDTLRSNCWTTAYEFLRNSGEDFTVFYVNQDAMQQKVLSKGTVVKRFNTENWTQDWNQGLRYGDVIAFIRKRGNELLHAASIVDPDLVFERSGIDDKQPYRLYPSTALILFYRKSYPGHEEMGDVDAVVYRFQNPSFPAPASHFAEGDFVTMQWLEHSTNRPLALRFRFDGNGRARLGDAAFQPLLR